MSMYVHLFKWNFFFFFTIIKDTKNYFMLRNLASLCVNESSNILCVNEFVHSRYCIPKYPRLREGVLFHFANIVSFHFSNKERVFEIWKFHCKYFQCKFNIFKIMAFIASVLGGLLRDNGAGIESDSNRIHVGFSWVGFIKQRSRSI